MIKEEVDVIIESLVHTKLEDARQRLSHLAPQVSSEYGKGALLALNGIVNVTENRTPDKMADSDKILRAVVFLFIASFGVALSGALMPGPVFTAVVGESTRRGAVAGPLFMGGHAILEAVLVGLIALGLGPLLARPEVFIVISMAGGVIMLYMAFGMFRSLPGLKMDLGGGDKRYGHLVWSGAVLSLSNPYWTVWWVTVGLGWISRGMLLGPAGVLAFYLGHIMGDLSWYSFLSVMVSKGRRFLNDRRYKFMIGFCGAALAGFGLWFLWSGGASLFKLPAV